MKFIKRIAVLVLVSIIALTASMENKINAAQSFELQIKSAYQTGEKLYKIWEVEDFNEFSYENLKDLDVAELNAKYSKSYTSSYVGNDTYSISSLTEGHYFGVEIENGVKKVETVPFLVSFFSDLDSIKTIIPKQAMKKTKLHILNFGMNAKGEKTIALPNSTFRIYYLNSTMPLRFLNGIATTDSEGITDMLADENGSLFLKGLLPGKYLIRQTSVIDGYLISQDLIVEIFLDKENILNVYNYEVSKVSNVRFTLLSKDIGKALKGGVFKLTRLVDGKYEDVIIDGKVLLGESDENGKFVFKNVPFGKYFLIQIKAPTDGNDKYIPISSPIEVDVDASMVNKEIDINVFNEKEKKSILTTITDLLPETGEQRSALFIGLGSILIFIAIIIILAKRKKKTDEEIEIDNTDYK